MRWMLYSFLFVLMLGNFAHAEIRVGALLAVTGSAAYLGMPEKLTLEMMVDMLNEEGGIDGDKVKLTVYDTQGSVERAITYYKRLVLKDKVDVVLCPTLSATSIAIKGLATRYKVPYVSCAASMTIITPPDNEYVFKSAQSDVHAVMSIYAHMNSKNIKRVGILTAQDSFGSTGRDALLQVAKDWGIEIVADGKFQIKDKDMTTQLGKIAREEPDAVIVWGVGAAVAIVAKNAKQLGIENLYMSHGVASQKFIDLAGSAADGITLPSGRLIVIDQIEDKRYRPIITEYRDNYLKRYNEEPSTFGGHAHDAFLLFKLAYEKGGKEGFVEAMESLKGVYGVNGQYNLSEDDHNGLDVDAFVMVEIVDGAFVLAD